MGALLGPLHGRLSNARVACVEVDGQAVRFLRRTIANRSAGLPPATRVHHGDFLGANVRSTLLAEQPEGFDCICMNPPFFGRGFPSQRVRSTRLGLHGVALPLEALFVVRALEHLRPGGRLLAIFPASVIGGDTTSALRSAMTSVGSFRAVHELPVYTFPGVDAAVFLVVYDLGVRTQRVTLLNHRLTRPDRLTVDAGSIEAGARLDYEFHAARSGYSALIDAWPELAWSPLSLHASVLRGSRRGGRAHKAVLHSAHTDGPVWRRPSAQGLDGRHEGGIAANDLLMARVHRSAAETVGMLGQAAPVPWSDCVYRIRPKRPQRATAIFFSTRVVLTQPEFGPLIMRGSGAKYVARDDLLALRIPVALADHHTREFGLWREALARRDIAGMREIETTVQAALCARLLPTVSRNPK